MVGLMAGNEVYVYRRKDNEDENDAGGGLLDLRIGMVEMDFLRPEAKRDAWQQQ
jgi:hypothetical protein